VGAGATEARQKGRLTGHPKARQGREGAEALAARPQTLVAARKRKEKEKELAPPACELRRTTYRLGRGKDFPVTLACGSRPLAEKTRLRDFAGRRPRGLGRVVL